jgi:2-methylisocitrate lyase-like PEP mutase family enzyme
MVERIVKSVNVPVSVDLEAGYGTTPQEICETVSAILKIGAVGINIEDANPTQPGELFPVMEQVQKIRAIKEFAQKENFPLFINARTDTFWLQLFSEEERLNQTIVRLKAYQDAGADGVFIPGLTDPQFISEIAKSINLPLNVLGGEWVKDTRELKLLGVSRFTIGSSATRDIAGHLKQRAMHLIKGKTFFTPSISYKEFCNLFLAKEDKDS